MLDDQDDKIRRNLLVYASLVIAAWWLDISLAQVAKSQLVFLKDVSVSKMLWLTLFVQTYLLLRYRFSRLSRRAWREYTVEVGRLIRRKVFTDISERLRSFHLNGQSRLFKPQLGLYIRREQDEHIGKDGIPYKMTEMSTGFIKHKGLWEGEVSCLRELTHSDGSYSKVQGGFGLEYEYDKWDRLVIRTKAALTVLLYTRGAVEMLFPVVLGLVSASIIGLQLLYGSSP